MIIRSKIFLKFCELGTLVIVYIVICHVTAVFHVVQRRGTKTSGNKISYFKFPNDKTLKKKWLHAIRREEGKYFKISNATTVCSRHFREDDYRKTLCGRWYLKSNVVPSKFDWIRSSPRKRNPPPGSQAIFV